MSARRQAAGISQTEVPHKVTSNERPNDQLKRVDHDIADLIKRCWHATPRNRPEFEEVRATLRRFPLAWTLATNFGSLDLSCGL